MLDISDLRASYQNVQVLHGIDLQVPDEGCLAVVGESGSGKTTLARCIVGMHREFTGTVRLAGDDLPPRAKQRPRESLRRMQYIFQNPYTALNPRKTIGQIIDQPLRHFVDLSRGERQERVRQVLSDVSLSEEFVDRYPDQLSGGERQRVAIARALAVEPDVLVCDEVTSALDVSVQAVIVELLRRLQRERRLSMVFITHNLALVRAIAQTVVVLSVGRVVEQGTVAQVLDEPTDDYTVRLLADVPRLSTA
jgi:peptide/nickel transport system ATP-binding protein